MMHCPFCKKAAHARTSRYLSDNVKQRYHQCTNIECSSTFRSIESIEEIIRSPLESFTPQTVPDIPMSPRMVKGCYSSPFRHNQEKRA